MKLSIYLCCMFLGLAMHAQSVISSTFSTTGSAFSNDDHSVHFSVGEPLNTLLSEGDLRLSQGLIQHLLSELPSAVASFQLEGIALYPNPTTSYIILENEEALQNLQYALYSINGKEIQPFRTLLQLKTSLNMETLPAGNYILRINKDNQYFQNLNLIKN